jgi:cell division control protein 6
MKLVKPEFEYLLQSSASSELPLDIYVERSELASLTNVFSEFLNLNAVPHHVYVFGKTGVGKTMTLLYLVNKLVKEKFSGDQLEFANSPFKIIFLSCRDYDTGDKIFTKISYDLASPDLMPLLEQHKKDNTVSVFIKDVVKQKKYRVLLVLDEIDHVIHDRASKDKFLLVLLRIQENLGLPSCFTVVTVTNEVNLRKTLRADTQSSLGTEVCLNTYSSNDLYDILRKRVEKAFYENNDGVTSLLHKISNYVEIKGDGNARTAIEVLYNAVKLCEATDKPLSECVEQAIKKQEYLGLTQELAAFSNTALVFLQTIALESKKRLTKNLMSVSLPTFTFNELSESYSSACEHLEKTVMKNYSVSDRWLRHFLDEFVSIGLIKAIKVIDENKRPYDAFQLLVNADELVSSINELLKLGVTE